MLVVSWFIGMTIAVFAYCYVFCKITNNKDFKITIKMFLLSLR